MIKINNFFEKYDFCKEPYDHVVVDNFFDHDYALKLSDEFLDYDSPNWFSYDNQIEIKKTCNNWFHFPKETSKVFFWLNSNEVVNRIKEIFNIKILYSDISLHGAGWHIHPNGGKLNVHFDYSLHPKLELQRKLNIIIYLTPNWQKEWGGNLEMWTHDEIGNQPKKLCKVVDNVFNRAVIFDTTQNSWHGFSDAISCPDNVYRKSMAMYYVTEPSENVDKRNRALFAPSEKQKNNKEVLELIKKRSNYD